MEEKKLEAKKYFSIYKICAGIPAADIVYRNFFDRRDGFTNPKQLVVSRTDFGKTFYFDYTQFQDGECLLYPKFSSRNP